MATYERVDYGSPDGCQIGVASTDLVAFHGATPCDQAAASTCISTSAALSVCGVYAFTSVQANALLTVANALIDALKEKGLMASS